MAVHESGLSVEPVNTTTAARPAPPRLVHITPLCSICDEPTEDNYTYYSCDGCDASWPVDADDTCYTTDGEWENPDDEQCSSTVAPFKKWANDPAFTKRQDETRRCYLDAGHEGWHQHPDQVGWRDDDKSVVSEPRCGSVVAPYARFVGHRSLSEMRFACVRPVGHDGQHRHPKYAEGWGEQQAAAQDGAS